MASLLIDATTIWNAYLTDELVFYLENMAVRFQEHHKPGTRKKGAYYLAQGPYNQALGLWYAGAKILTRSKSRR